MIDLGSQNDALIQSLNEFGILFPSQLNGEPSHVSFDEKTKELIVFNTDAELKLIEKVLKKLQDKIESGKL